MPESSEIPIIQRTQAALQHTRGKTVETCKFAGEGIVLRFTDGSVLEIDIGVEQSKPILMAHFSASRKGTAA